MLPYGKTKNFSSDTNKRPTIKMKKEQATQSWFFLSQVAGVIHFFL